MNRKNLKRIGGCVTKSVLTAIFMICVLILSQEVVFTETAFGEETSCLLAAKETKGEPGDTVTVEVSITGNPGINALDLTIAYDEENLTLTGVTDGLLNDPTVNLKNGMLSWDAAENMTGDGVLFTLNFKISETADKGTYPVSLTDVTVGSGAGVDITNTVKLQDGSILAAPAVRTVFKDVRETDWYYETVYEVYDRGIMVGMKADTFGPGVAVNRAMFATILYKLDGAEVTAEKLFPDVSRGDWFAAPVTWAKKNGIINGYSNGYFGPADSITREQVAVILYNYAVKKDLKTDGSVSLDSYPDAKRVSGYAETAMKWAVGNGLISGNKGNLEPQGNATRAQVASIIIRFIKAMNI